MNPQHFDALIIGFGKGGKTLAAFIARQGMKVAMVEQSKQMYGGTCINIACIPSKALALAAAESGRRHFATFAEQETFYVHALEEKNHLVSFLRQKNYDNLHSLSTVTIIDGKATFLSPGEVQVQLRGAEPLLIQADRIFINTGTLPAYPSIEGLSESKHVYTSTSLMDLRLLPRELVIIGCGYVGLEFASIYRAFGSRVTALDKLALLLPHQDRDIADAIEHTLEQKGIEFRFNTTVHRIEDRGDRTYLAVLDPTGKQQEIAADAVLVAIGREPNVGQLGLEEAGVEVNEHGFINVDEFLHTSAPNTWALGDVNGGPQFTYISLDDYRIVRDQLYAEKKHSRRDRRHVPYAVFIHPTLSWVGLTEGEARRQGYEIKVAKLPAAAIPRAQQLQETEGLLKAVIDAQTHQLLGCTLFCADSSEVINTVAMALSTKLDYRVVRDTIFTHPSMSEALNDLLSQVN